MAKRLWAVFMARNIEFIRDRTALIWSLFFPLLLILAFAFAFSDDARESQHVAVFGTQPDTGFFQLKHITWHPVTDLDVGKNKISRHQYDLLINTNTQQFWYNPDSTKGYFLSQILSTKGFKQNTIEGEAIRYVHWVIPGIITMNMMFSALYGVGFVIIRYRKIGVLKRLKATPLSAFEFLTAQVLSRLAVILVTSILVFLCVAWVIDFPMRGSYLDLLILYGIGSLSMISLGLIFASRIANEEMANGVLNLITWPMILLSGIWFSVDNLHPSIQTIAHLLPLTHITEGARAIMIDGQGLWEIADNLLFCVATAVLFLAIGAYWFVWDQQ
ncbi:MAG: ABC transporter permease [Methylococcales bacterium]|jgi:ABC-2 type transport system permease protein|nr:ABC transporter permease [Methylococcales bacterium]MBT7444481.1 ABC transporter permease [Methylococcales bacterium]